MALQLRIPYTTRIEGILIELNKIIIEFVIENGSVSSAGRERYARTIYRSHE